MADFKDHVAQAGDNLRFLSKLNVIPHQWDWKVTVGFYVAVHLVNAHLAKVGNLHFRQHKQVEDAISPHSILVAARLPEAVYVAYRTLKNLSRRARYLCSDNPTDVSQNTFVTQEKHLAKALRNLDVLMLWFGEQHSYHFLPCQVACTAQRSALRYFPLTASSQESSGPKG